MRNSSVLLCGESLGLQLAPPTSVPTEYHTFPAWFCSHQKSCRKHTPTSLYITGQSLLHQHEHHLSLDNSPCRAEKSQTHPETVGREPGADDCHFSCCFRKDFASFELESTSLVTLLERKETNQRVRRQKKPKDPAVNHRKQVQELVCWAHHCTKTTSISCAPKNLHL